jgi:hypothetical protein
MTSSVRSEKGYCCQLIHHGVCASSRMGCKNLQVMPLDADLQVELVLYHGMPWQYREIHNRTELAESGIWLSNRQNSSLGNVRSKSKPALLLKTILIYSSASFGPGQSFGPIAPPKKS